MKITPERLLEKGFKEKQFKDNTIFYNDDKALVEQSGSWIPCRILNGSLYYRDIAISTMEDLEFIMK